MLNRRWYDKHQETKKAFSLLNALNTDLKEKFSKDIIDVSLAIKSINNESDEPPLSIGKERVLGIYKASQNRRWYDTEPFISIALKTVSTLPEADYKHIMQGICLSVEE